MNILHIHWLSLANPLCAMLLSPLLLSVIQSIKAWFGGRVGPPLLQPYFDMWRLLHKTPVYSRTTSWFFLLGPTVGLAALILVQFILPLGSHPGFISFGGDFILLTYLLAIARFCTILAALDTNSTFAALGASRTAFFSLLAEPALLLGFAAVAHVAHTQVIVTATPIIAEAKAATEFPADPRDIPPAFDVSMSHIHALLSFHTWRRHGVVLTLVATAFFIVLLCENSRMPVEDPASEDELSMIHQGMTFEHSGPDLAFIKYTAALKLWALGSLLLGMVTPANTSLVVDLPSAIAAMFLLAMVIGIIISCLARWSMARVPRLLMSAAALSALALVIEYGYGD